MAGGPHAARVACIECLAEFGRLVAARRVREGVETDHYRCRHGHRFGLTFPKGPPGDPEWPPPAELAEAGVTIRADRGDRALGRLRIRRAAVGLAGVAVATVGALHGPATALGASLLIAGALVLLLVARRWL